MHALGDATQQGVGWERRRPKVSIKIARFRPLDTFLAAASPLTPANAVVLTLELSIMPAVGCLWRPAVELERSRCPARVPRFRL